MTPERLVGRNRAHYALDVCSGVRWIVLGLVAAMLLVIAPLASGGGDQGLVVTQSWTSDCSGYVVETLTHAVSACRTPPAGWSGSEFAVAADGTMVGSGQAGGGAPVTLLRPGGKLVELDSSPNDFDASISYDGSKVVFARFDPATWSSDIYVINADGSGLTLVASGGTTESLTLPEFSPDGGSIAYMCDQARQASGSSLGCGPLMDGTYRGSGVMLMNADGGDKRMILIGDGDAGVQLSGNVSSLSWSPDGQWLAMNGCRTEFIPPDSYTCQEEVFAYRTDGSDLFNMLGLSRQVTHEPSPRGGIFPQFSPDGSQILLLRTVNDQGVQGNFAYLINRDGTNEHQVFLSPDPLTCTAGVCSGHPDLGHYIPPATGGGPAPTVNATRITVPGVRTLGYHLARRRLQAAHLTARVSGRRFSARIPRNHVISQYPRAGAHAHRLTKQGPPVKLTLSRGPRRS